MDLDDCIMHAHTRAQYTADRKLPRDQALAQQISQQLEKVIVHNAFTTDRKSTRLNSSHYS